MRRHYATEMQLIAALIVSSGLTFVRPNHQMSKKAADTDINDESGIQANLHNFFNSITDNDEKRTQNYRIILEQDAAKERKAFDAMKEELKFARQRNAYKQRDVNPKDSNVIVVKRETPVSSVMNIAEVIDDSWIRSQTLTTSYHLTLPMQTRTTPQTQSTTPSETTIWDLSVEDPVPEEHLAKNARLEFQAIDKQYAGMRSSSKWSDFSRIRDDAIFLQYYTNLKQAPNTSEDLLPEVYHYFEEWPTVSVENWKDQLSPDEMFRYLEYEEEHVLSPPHLVLRWTIFTTWIMKSKEWKDSSRVPEPMQTRFRLMEAEFRKMNEEEKIPVVEIGRAYVDAFRNDFRLD